MNRVSEADREAMGRYYMALATQYGYIELEEGSLLYSAKGLQGATDEAGNPVVFENDFYFSEGKYLYECSGPDNVMDFIEDIKEKQRLLEAKIIPFPDVNFKTMGS
jgi:hypothetical protein